MHFVAENIEQLIGKTPIIHLHQLAPNLYGKLESFNPCSSVKDRLAKALLDDAVEKGLLHADTHIVEATSGNTGIGLAFLCASRGIKLKLLMPETMSIERRKMLALLGAEVILTPGSEGMKGAVARASALVAENPEYISLGQFTNPANVSMHYRTTAPEIWTDMGGKVDLFVAGVGTGGTFTGCAKYLKEKYPALKAIAVEPAASPVLSGGLPGPHKIQGIGAGFIPPILDLSLANEIIQVSNDEAFAMMNRLAKETGVVAGISCGAAVHAAVQLANRSEYRASNIVVILPDSGERYLSML